MSLKSLFIRIRQWLKKNPQIWRYLCCASAVAGLLCFALSSYFHNLFRHWNLLKIILYSVATAGICVVLWFAQNFCSQEGSTTRRFHAYVKVSTLILGCIISGFVDKALNKRPDMYGLTSCAAFAVMSFSLSRQTDYGFEAEMESFFMGTLLGQLWLVKWWYLSAGGGFWCLLTTLRSFLDAPSVDENVERQDRQFWPIQVDSDLSNASDALLSVPQQPNSSTDGILQEFWYTLRKLNKGQPGVFVMLFDNLHRYLTEEDEQLFPFILVNDPNILVDELPLEAINESNEKVGLMIAGGLENRCWIVYSTWRRENLKLICENLWQGTGFLENDSDLVEQSHMIKSWIKLSYICMRVLFPYERRLCDRVFSGFSSVSNICFTNVCSEMTSKILNFAKVWAEVSYFYPLNRTLQVFETLHGLIPLFESLFSDKYSAPLRNEATTITNALGEAIRDFCLNEFEDMIRHDIEQESVLGGIHPITIKVMDRLLTITDGKSLLSVEMARIIEPLETHLKKRSKSYPNNALGYVFLMNNQRYIVLKVRRSQLGATFGDDWIQQQMAKFRQHLEHYQRSSWDEVLGILKLDNNEELNMTTNSRIEKLESFNKHFKQIWKDQCTWFVIEELREELRKYLENILLPAYGLFLGRLYNDIGKSADKYIRYSIHELGDLLKDLFNGREKIE